MDRPPIIQEDFRCNWYNKKARRLRKSLRELSIDFGAMIHDMLTIHTVSLPNDAYNSARNLQRTAELLADTIVHIVPGTPAERARIMMNIILLGLPELHDVLYGNCTEAYLYQYNYDPMPQIWREHNIKYTLIVM